MGPIPSRAEQALKWLEDLTRFDPSDLTRFDPSDLTRFDPSDLTRFDPSDLTRFDPSDLTRFDPSDLTRFDPSDLTRFDPSDLTRFDSSDLTRFDPSDLTRYDPSDLTRFDPCDLTRVDSYLEELDGALISLALPAQMKSWPVPHGVRPVCATTAPAAPLIVPRRPRQRHNCRRRAPSAACARNSLTGALRPGVVGTGGGGWWPGGWLLHMSTNERLCMSEL